MAASTTGTTQFLSKASAVVTGPPMSMACWVNVPATLNFPTFMLLWNTAGGARHSIFGNASASPWTVGAASFNGTTTNSAVTSTSFSTGSWNHLCAVWASASSRAAYLNGGGKGTDATSNSPTGMNKTTLSGDQNGNGFAFSLALPTYWNVALSDTDVAALALGVSPLKIHPEAIVAFLPIIGGLATEPDIVSSTGWTNNSGTMTAVANPRIYAMI